MSLTDHPYLLDETKRPQKVLTIDLTNQTFYQEFYIYGQTRDQSKNASIKLLGAVCGTNFPYAADDSGSLLLTQLSQPDTIETTRTVSMLDLYSFASPNPVLTAERCLTNFTLCDDIECGDPIERMAREYLEVNGLDLIIKQSEPNSPKNLYVGVQQPDQSWLKLPIYHEVCGYENISPVQAGTEYVKQSALLGEDYLDIELYPLFSNDSPNEFCPVVAYSLKADEFDETPLDSSLNPWISINDTHVTINEYMPFMTFAVMAETANGRKGWKKFNVALDQCGDQTVLATQDPLHVQVTKNSGTQVLLLEATAVHDNFYTGLAGVCPVIDYDYTFPAGSPILPSAFANVGDSNIYIDTTLANIFEYNFTAASVTGLTNELRSGSYDVSVSVGCYKETIIQKNFEPYSTSYDFATILPKYEAGDPSEVHVEEVRFDTFITEISECFASRLELCADAFCSNQYNGAYLSFEQNPAEKDVNGFPIANLQIDRSYTDLYQEVFIMGTTLDPNVKSIIKGIVAVCGARFTYAANDPANQLYTQKNQPDSDLKLVHLMPMFEYATSDPVFPASACLQSFTICSWAQCDLASDYADYFDIDQDTHYLTIRQDLPVAPLELYIGVKQPDDSYLKLPLYLEVCGYETITSTDAVVAIT
jgi:hypothetical protein